MVLRVLFQLFKGVSPDCFHVIPVIDNSMVNWIAQFYQTFIFLILRSSMCYYLENTRTTYRLLSNEPFLFGRADHYSFVFWPPNTIILRLEFIALWYLLCIKYEFWFLFTTKSCFHDARTLFDYKHILFWVRIACYRLTLSMMMACFSIESA